MSKKHVSLNKVYIVYGFVLLFGLAIVFRILFVQVTEGDTLRAKAKECQVKTFSLEASRGNILASDGTLMSVSVPRYNIFVDLFCPKKKLYKKKRDSLALCLSQLYSNRSKSYFLRMFRRALADSNRYLVLKKNVSYMEMKKIKSFPILRKGKYKGGLIVKKKNSRIRPYQNLALRTIGYYRQDTIAVGIEGAFSKYLRGVNGAVIKRKIGHGDWMEVSDDPLREAKNGMDVQTTIDVNVQDVAEETLYDQLYKEKAYEGCAILMEVKTGFIKAIANLRWDPKLEDYRESYNMAIGERIEPGSTFKLASIIVALEDGKVDMNQVVDIENGKTTFFKHKMRDSHFGGEREITLRTAFEKSSNVGISKVINHSYKDEPEAFIEGLEKLGLTEPLGINLLGEPKPDIPGPDDKKRWSGLSLPWMSIGYGLSLTPLQMLSLYNAVANDGKLMKPQFVQKILHNGEVVESYEPVVLRDRICSSETLDTVRSLLEGVVLRGTGRNLASPFYSIAGKTGTAQIAKGGKYNKVNYNASFVGYFPANNPRYSCIVVVANPSAGRIYGSSVAGPVFKGMADKIYALDIDFNESPQHVDDMHIPYKNGACITDLKEVFLASGVDIDTSSCNTNYVYLKGKENKALFLPRVIKDGIMPNLIGMGARDAVYILRKNGLIVEVEGKGDISYQSVLPGKRIKKGQNVKLKLST
ncbi:MAG: penicillin-binding protein [Bacteroidales bacterium]